MKAPLFVACTLLFAQAASAGPIVVPDDHATIQEAIDAAALTFDFVFVRAGTYNENLNLEDMVNVVGDTEGVVQVVGTGVGSTILADGVTANLSNLTISGGNSPNSGGGLRVISNSTVTVTDCIFDSNAADGSGGGVGVETSTATFENSLFTQNSAGGGAGMFVRGASSSVDVTDCMFDSNATTGGPGGGILTQDALDVEVLDCIFTGNSADIGGSMSLDNSTMVVTGCTMYANTALEEAGAIQFHNGSSGIVTSCTIYGNDGGRAGGISCTNNSSPTISRTIIANAISGPAFACGQGSTPIVSCSNTFGNPGGDTICGTDSGDNISVDPKFCSTMPGQDGNFALQSDSPCLASQSLCGMLIGASDTVCGASPVGAASWGRIKASYR